LPNAEREAPGREVAGHGREHEGSHRAVETLDVCYDRSDKVVMEVIVPDHDGGHRK
jgi:hypothetical protein